MTYRPTEFEVENHPGIALEIRLHPECPMDEGGNVWFEISQDSASIVANLGALEMLVDAANELLAGLRERAAASNQVGEPARVNDGIPQRGTAGGSAPDADVQDARGARPGPDGNDALKAAFGSAAIGEERPVLGVENHGASYSAVDASQARTHQISDRELRQAAPEGELK